MGLSPGQIDQSLVGYVPGQPSFTQTVFDTLGNVGDATDGWDVAMAPVLAAFPSTNNAQAQLQKCLADVFQTAQDLNFLDPSDLVLDFNESAPVITSFLENFTLRNITPFALPALPAPPVPNPPLPAPVPVECVPAPAPTPPPVCQPAPPGPPGATPPPLPVPNPCPPGFISTSVGCNPSPAPCPSGFVSTATGCQPEQPPAPAPQPPPILPPIIIPHPKPGCPPGFISTATGCIDNPQPPLPPPIILPPAPAPCPPDFISTPEGCQPSSTGGAGGAFALDTILGGIIQNGIIAGSNGAAMFGGGLPLAVALPAAFANIVVPVLAAFILFNDLFGGLGTSIAQYGAWFKQFAEKNPAGAEIYSLNQQLTQLQAALPHVGQFEYTQIQQQIARIQSQIAQLTPLSIATMTGAQKQAFITWAGQPAGT